ncbi:MULTISPECIES: aspartate aminotransferase family protein [unclassified Leisingera]|uniref:aspartate aminotransferase family protein n=1 Tax=unclassified Leisingera TaxID=2614906 RepID=UPI00031BED8B|nr:MULTISPECIES: aspartate aminotransferase family protein [unclassified Leisingera]KIC24086.1 omega amino acid--pyruvate aminotransferase [Leisingera sp. ANG-S3]KIC52488.1 omega amino acid--pyruvate aminotransferase [Leisingera sp. ANG-S]KID09874.1 omega amino acid--pyruvate aminotransferase [Leisingera sp. ANG1]
MTTDPKRANAMDAYWMPFTANRHFKENPRMVASAEGMYYTTTDGRKVMDGTAGLWCVNAGHAAPRITEAVQKQVTELDYAPAFQMGHPKAFELAARLADLAPGDLNHVFFTNSGSESVETALKIALAYHKAKGEPGRTRLIGREKGYHGVNFGGISVGGIVNNRRHFGSLLTGVDHLRHTHDPERNAFTKGQPEHGAELAEDLVRLIELHGAETIAAVIVEPMAGSAGVILPPKGYLERLREITREHGILLIFDEVITAYGRLGRAFGADYYGVEPDMITTAKGLTNGVIPMGAVMISSEIHDAFMTGPENLIELFHGYTYSGNPVACAAALAALDTYREEQLFERAAGLEDYWTEALFSLKGLPHVADIRCSGLVGAVELEPVAGQPTKRAFDTYLRAWDRGAHLRTTGDIIAMSPPLIIEKSEIDELIGILAESLIA